MKKLMILGLATLGVACSKPSEDGDVNNIIETAQVNFSVNVGGASSSKSSKSAKVNDSDFIHQLGDITVTGVGDEDLTFTALDTPQTVDLEVSSTHQYSVSNVDPGVGYSNILPISATGSFTVESGINTVNATATTEWGLFTLSSDTATITSAVLSEPSSNPALAVSHQDGYDYFQYIKEDRLHGITIEYEALDSNSNIVTGTATTESSTLNAYQHQHFVFIYASAAETAEVLFSISVAPFTKLENVEFNN